MEYKTETHGHRQQCGGDQREGVGGLGNGGLIYGDGGRFDFGGGQTVGNTDLASQKCTLDTHMILLTNLPQ